MVYVTQPLGTLIFTVAAGILSLILSRKLRLPSILFLLAFGMLLGPECLDVVRPTIFRHNFPHYISLMVAVILFEGAASLKAEQWREVSFSVRRLLTLGVGCTLVTMSLLTRWVTGMDWTRCVLLAAILVVTGPAVVVPILQRLSVGKRLHNALKWEGILIDPLGVILSVLLFEAFVARSVGLAGPVAFFAMRVVVGAVFGLCAGYLMEQGLKRDWLFRYEGKELGGLYLLACNLLFFGLSEWMFNESGLVTVTVAGLYIGNKKFAFKEEIFHFKEQVTQFAISVLFILIASNIPISAFKDISREGFILLALLILVVRPLSALVSVLPDRSLGLNEKLFMAAFAPRGIVSAVLASHFALEFEQHSLHGGGRFLPLTFFLICGTILFYAVFSAPIAWILRVLEGPKRGLVIIGANALGRELAARLKATEVPVVLIDSNPGSAYWASSKGLECYIGSGFDPDFIESLDLKGIGASLAVTSNHEVNVLTCGTFSRFVGRGHVHRIWDKSDRWDRVTSAHYDGSLGYPNTMAAGLEPSDLIEGYENGHWTLETVTLTEPLRALPEALKERGYEVPLFAVIGSKVVFPSPGATLPKDSLLLHLKRSQPGA